MGEGAEGGAVAVITFPLLGQAGRLGNQMWQIASTIGLARAYGEEVRLPDWAYRPYFSVPDEFFGPAEGTDATNLVPHLDPRAALYLQDFNLWRDCAGEIRRYFQPSQLALDELPLEALAEYDLAVHVRRGDNAYDPGTPDKHLYHPLRSLDYYKRAADHFPDATILVFSDDPEWCRENLDWDVFVGGKPRPKEHEPEYATAPVTDWIDLLAMSRLPGHIISNSTYAWWGAFISGDEHAIYPSNWFGPNLGYIDSSLMFPDGWVEVYDPTSRGET